MGGGQTFVIKWFCIGEKSTKSTAYWFLTRRLSLGRLRGDWWCLPLIREVIHQGFSFRSPGVCDTQLLFISNQREISVVSLQISSRSSLRGWKHANLCQEEVRKFSTMLQNASRLPVFSGDVKTHWLWFDLSAQQIPKLQQQTFNFNRKCHFLLE